MIPLISFLNTWSTAQLARLGPMGQRPPTEPRSFEAREWRLDCASLNDATRGGIRIVK